MRLLILDNYDSFTYNLLHQVEKCSDILVDVIKNDVVKIEEIEKYDKILLSPGPGLPKDAGLMPEILKKYHRHKSILGICLGLQGIGEFFGCGLINLQTVFHGIATPITIIDQDPLFENCPSTFSVGRYHSWVIDRSSAPIDFIITAEDNKNMVMAARHRKYDVRGVQFHPESILSEFGETIIHNWINLPFV